MTAVQRFAMAASDGLAGAFHCYGLLHPRVVEGEAWRLLTGPFLHYSVEHFLLNAVLVTTLGALAWAFYDWVWICSCWDSSPSAFSVRN